MKVNTIQTTNTNFRASIAQTPAVQNTTKFLSEHRMRPGKIDWTVENYLWDKINTAILWHQSQQTIYTDVAEHFINYYDNRGVIKTDLGKVVGKDNSIFGTVLPVLKVWAEFLNPENKDTFNRLMGIEYEKDYQPWWDRNIKPYWNDISKRFGQI